MTFNPNKPLPNDLLSVSQNDLLVNNQSLDSVFAINHFAFSDATTNSGKHSSVVMPERAMGPATLASEGAIYTKDSGGITRAFWRPENTLAGGVEFEMTNIDPYLSAPNGYTFLPNGLLLIFGNFVSNGSSSQAVTFPNGLTLTATPYSVTAVTNAATSFVGVSAVTTTGFTVNKTAGARIFWMAIGSR